MRMLEEEGFAWENYIDIFDGGPTMTVRTDQIRSVREAKDAQILTLSDTLGDPHEGKSGGTKMLVTHGLLQDFRASYGWIEQHDNGVILDTQCAANLGVGTGDTVTFVPRW